MASELTKGRVIELTLAGITAGVSAASLNIAARFTPDVSDVLGWAGAIIGAAAAVLGTVWAAQRSRQLEHAEKREVLVEALILTAQRALAIGERVDRIQGVYISLIQNLILIKTLVQNTPIHNANALQGLSLVVYWADRYIPLLEKANDEVTNAQMSRDDSLKKYRPLVYEIGMNIRMALEAPDYWPKNALERAGNRPED